MKASFINTAVYSSSSFTNPSYALDLNSKKASTISLTDTTYEITMNGDFVYIVTDASEARLVAGAYDSGYESIDGSKLWEISYSGTATIYFKSVTSLGLVFSGDFIECGIEEYPINEEVVDYGFEKETINGSILYEEGAVLIDYSYNLFSTHDEYHLLREIQRENRNNCVVYLENEDVMYGFMELINGTEERKKYYNTQIKIQGE